MKKTILLLAGLAFFQLPEIYAQETFPVNGVHDERHGTYAFTNATIFKDHATRLENATLLIEKGKVKQIGTNVSIPDGVPTLDLEGKHIYPSFIDLFSNYGLPKVEDAPRASRSGPPQIESETPGAYNWNQAIRAYYNAAEEFTTEKSDAEAMRKQGWGALLTSKHDGIARGTGALVSLGEGKENEIMLRDRAAALLSFNKGSSTQNYPSSLMGSIALLRQTYLDAQWYENGRPDDFTDQALAAFNNQKGLPKIFEAADKFDVLRADKIGDEFDEQYIIKGAGDEYQRLEAVKGTSAQLILPLNFPDAYDVEDPYDAIKVSLTDMKHWELAPANPAILADAGINFAFTASDLKDKTKIHEQIKKAIEYGLSYENALKALTTTPAQMLEAADMIGQLNEGAVANFIITNDSLFTDETVIFENWVQGKKYIVTAMPEHDIRGDWTLNVNDSEYALKISGKVGSPEMKIDGDTTNNKIKVSVSKKLITLYKSGEDGFRLSGYLTDERMQGDGKLSDGSNVSWNAEKTGDYTPESEEKKQSEKPEIGNVFFPFVAFGQAERPEPETILFQNATVWSNTDDGILEETDVLVRDGKIQQVGKGLSAGNATVIDATGKHLTSGIIDEHSHVAIAKGVNEGTQAVTAEVRIGDVINPDDINIYRQLAGGVTASQLLHGSANPIGGQSAIVKLRWGVQDPEAMKIENADGFIKFALGENVKQSNWGQFSTNRFPQTRMGVEQVYYDAFTRAKAYKASWEEYNGLSNRARKDAKAPRRDLELETLVEILDDERFISCHSYVQSEINMLMKAANDLGFKINTFTHILEGYKVADKMKENNIGGSTFADWWAYKYEVQEAIPFNASIMYEQGITTAINSDDAEMGRRLNQEAAKTVMYGDVPEEDAWKMVTLNPAKLLHLDDRMGSVEAGKDADLVLWSDHPLSIYTLAEKTLVDGVVLFDRERDATLREENEQERNRIITRMLDEKAEGKPTQNARSKASHMWHCDHVGDIFQKSYVQEHHH